MIFYVNIFGPPNKNRLYYYRSLTKNELANCYYVDSKGYTYQFSNISDAFNFWIVWT